MLVSRNAVCSIHMSNGSRKGNTAQGVKGHYYQQAVQTLLFIGSYLTVNKDAFCQGRLHNEGYVPGPLICRPEQGVESEHSVAYLHQLLKQAEQEYA